MGNGNWLESSGKNRALDQSEFLAIAGKAAAIAAGAGLVYEIFRHRRLLTTLGVCAGSALLVKRYIDGCGCATQARRVDNLHLGSPSFRGDTEYPSTQEPKDEIDEAMMESFPASDPPASYRRS